MQEDRSYDFSQEGFDPRRGDYTIFMAVLYALPCPEVTGAAALKANPHFASCKEIFTVLYELKKVLTL